MGVVLEDWFLLGDCTCVYIHMLYVRVFMGVRVHSGAGSQWIHSSPIG